MLNKVCCFGEILLRYSPLANGESFLNQSMPVYVGGAELNVANALAKWNIPVAYCSAMPDNFLSVSILNHLSANKIDTTPVNISGSRLGVYYLQQGTDVKSNGVVFDRANSSFANLQPGTLNWNEILEGVTWFHFSAIAAAISTNATNVCLEALAVAKEKNIKISIDLNYRASLWKYGKEPIEVMPNLLKYCDVVMGNIWAAEKLLNIPSTIENSDQKNNNELQDAAVLSMKMVHQNYPNVSAIAYTFRLSDSYFAVLSKNENFVASTLHQVKNVVDKVGSGDCFMAALIYADLQNFDEEETINFAAAAAVGKFYEKGDSTNQTVDVIKTRYQSNL